jgi:hypothetical protein
MHLSRRRFHGRIVDGYFQYTDSVAILGDVFTIDRLYYIMQYMCQRAYRRIHLYIARPSLHSLEIQRMVTNMSATACVDIILYGVPLKQLLTHHAISGGETGES